MQNPASVLAPKGTIGIVPGMPLPIGVVMRERKGPLLILCPELRIITCFGINLGTFEDGGEISLVYSLLHLYC